MIRYYIVPLVLMPDELSPNMYGPKALNVLTRPPNSGIATSWAGPHTDGWMLGAINAPDHSELDADPECVDPLAGVLDIALTHADVLQKIKLPIPGNKASQILAGLAAKGINNTGITTARDVLGAYLGALGPGLRLEDMRV